MKNTSKKAELPQCDKTAVISRFSNTIELWLKSDINGNWIRNEKNTNTFTDIKSGRALYVYEDCIKYWDDIRQHSGVCEYMIPASKIDLFDILGA